MKARLFTLRRSQLIEAYNAVNVAGIPDGAVVASAFHSGERDCVVMVVEHPSFGDIADGCEFPYVRQIESDSK